MNHPVVLYVGDAPVTVTLTALSRLKTPVSTYPKWSALDREGGSVKGGIVDLHISEDGMSAIIDPIAPGFVTLDVLDDGSDPKAAPVVKPVLVVPAQPLAPDFPPEVKGDATRERAFTDAQRLDEINAAKPLPVATGPAHTTLAIEVRAANAHSLHLDVGQPSAANRAEVDRIKRAIKPVPERKVEPAPINPVHVDHPAHDVAPGVDNTKTA